MSRVSWDRLTLKGFGRYQQAVSVEFDRGLAVLMGPNESGKTTLIAGLTAVLFGLPVNQDRAQFGQARWRNWQQPARFQGELHFTARSQQWHLTRDFASNQISLKQRLGDSWREVVQGVDNPGARRSLRRYHEQLRQLIGIERRELWQTTFCLTQPLPAPHSLDDAVQVLLSGSDRRVEQVQAILDRQVRAITRYYGSELGSGRDGNKDRQLEELQTEIAQLQQAIAAGCQVADGLQVVQAELRQAEQRQAELAGRLELAERSHRAWGVWRSYQERYGQQLAEQQRLVTAVGRAGALSRRLEQFGQWQAESGSLEQAGPEQIPKLMDYQRQQRELDLRQRQAEREHQALLSREQTYRRTESEWQQQHGVLQPEPAHLLEEIDLYLSSRGGRGTRRQADSSVGAAIPWVLAVGAALTTFLFWGKDAAYFGLLGSLLAAGLAFWLGSAVTKSLGRREPPQVKAQLGKLGKLTLPELLAARAALERLAAAQAARPSEAEMRAAQAELRQVQLESDHLRQEYDSTRQALQHLLALFSAGTVAELEIKALHLQNSIAATQLRWQELIDGHPGLPARELGEQRGIEDLFVASEQRVAALRQSEADARQRVQQLLRQQATLQGQQPLNIAQAEDRLALLIQQRDQLQLEVEALGFAYRQLAAAKEGYQLTYRASLASQATAHLCRITGQPDRQVELGPDFQVTVFTDQGQAILPAQLSQGTRDQLYFALRLAIADLLTDQARLPLILDDPFVNSDAERLQRIHQALLAAAKERQILLFTHQQPLADWGRDSGDRPSVPLREAE